MPHQAELFILTLRDDSPIPLPFLSWYSIFDLHRCQLLPCLRIPREPWHNLSAKGYKKPKEYTATNCPSAASIMLCLDTSTKELWSFCCSKKDIKMQELIIIYFQMGKKLLITGSWKSGHHFSIASKRGRKWFQALGSRLQFSCTQKANLDQGVKTSDTWYSVQRHVGYSSVTSTAELWQISAFL